MWALIFSNRRYTSFLYLFFIIVCLEGKYDYIKEKVGKNPWLQTLPPGMLDFLSSFVEELFPVPMVLKTILMEQEMIEFLQNTIGKGNLTAHAWCLSTGSFLLLTMESSLSLCNCNRNGTSGAYDYNEREDPWVLRSQRLTGLCP